jgi:hypothetical protein
MIVRYISLYTSLIISFYIPYCICHGMEFIPCMTVVDNVSNAHEQGEPEDESYYDFWSQGEDLDSGGRTRNEDSEAKVTNHFLEPPLAFDKGYIFCAYSMLTKTASIIKQIFTIRSVVKGNGN